MTFDGWLGRLLASAADPLRLLAVTEDFEAHELVDVLRGERGLVELHAELLHPDRCDANHKLFFIMRLEGFDALRACLAPAPIIYCVDRNCARFWVYAVVPWHGSHTSSRPLVSGIQIQTKAASEERG